MGGVLVDHDQLVVGLDENVGIECDADNSVFGQRQNLRHGVGCRALSGNIRADSLFFVRRSGCFFIVSKCRCVRIGRQRDSGTEIFCRCRCRLTYAERGRVRGMHRAVRPEALRRKPRRVVCGRHNFCRRRGRCGSTLSRRTICGIAEGDAPHAVNAPLLRHGGKVTEPIHYRNKRI